MIRPLLIGVAFVAPVLSIALALAGTNIVGSLAPLFASHLLLLYATLVPNHQWWGPIVTRFETSEQEVWLTIDDGPCPAHTLRILDLLEQFDARATFFVVGERADKFPHLITEILTRGHTLANHTYTHPRATFWCAGPSKIGAETDACAETMRTTPERPARYFRSPVGMTNPFVHPVLARRGLQLIGWSVRGLDTILRDPDRVVARIEKHVRPGAIILLHEGQRVDTHPEFNLRCLELTLQRLTSCGYRFVIPSPERLRT
ncbi:MAG: polysaccharide deacetylase family protein [Verrucomicrobiota bacterium]|nr:polysaccharide deacetylase family protein [Verrucomicrobiota bacterium]